MKNLLYVLLGLSLFIFGCTEEGNVDNASEISCASATGTWVVSGVTCDGTAMSVAAAQAFTFNSATSISHEMGGASCASTLNWDSVHGDFDNTLNMTGNGNLTCSSGGSSVSSCTSAANNCNSSTDITGFINNYDTCAISGTTMTWSRTMSASNNPNGLSSCAVGEVEQVTLSQSSTASGMLAVVESEPGNFGTIAAGSSSSMTFNLTNNGSVAASTISASGLSGGFSFSGGSFPGGGTCGASLAAGASCTFIVNFSPTTAGSFFSTVTFSYSDGSANQSYSYDVQGAASGGGSTGLLVIQGVDPYDFGAVPAGGQATVTFTVENVGGGAATSLNDGGSLLTPFRFTGGSFPGSSGTCAGTLASLANCTIEVEFSPVTVGLESGTVSLSYNDGSTIQTTSKNIQGTGVAPAVLIISESDPYDFGSVLVSAGPAFHTFTVTNVGGYSATSVASGSGPAVPFGYGGGAYPGVGGDCSLTLSPGSSCSIHVEFDPVSASPANDQIELFYNDGVSTQSTTRQITGTGI